MTRGSWQQVSPHLERTFRLQHLPLRRFRLHFFAAHVSASQDAGGGGGVGRGGKGGGEGESGDLRPGGKGGGEGGPGGKGGGEGEYDAIGAAPHVSGPWKQPPASGTLPAPPLVKERATT